MKLKQKPTFTEIMPQSPHDIVSKKRGKKVAGLVIAASLSAGAAIGTAAASVVNINEKANRAETSAATAQQNAFTALMQANQAEAELNARVIQDEQQSEYIAGIAGLTSEQLSEHMSYPSVPETKGKISPEVAARQDAATLYLFKGYAGAVNDPSIPLNFACTVFKTGAQTLNSAAHCFPDVYEKYASVDPSTSVSGGGYTQPSGYITNQDFYISNKPELTVDEAQNSAAHVTGFNKDYSSTDSAVLHVEQPADGSSWFNDITPLNQRATIPAKGTAMRVSGYPAGKPEHVSGEGVVLGQLPASLVGFNYASSLTIVGIYPDPNLPISMYDCSFGGSGETAVDDKAEWFGDLAFIQRSTNPSDSINATPSGTRLIDMETALKTKLAGENYILCGFAPAAPIEPLPLINDSTFIQPMGK